MELSRYRFFRQIIERPYVDAVYLFGSRARGDNDDWSDIDLAIACPHVTAEQWQDLVHLAHQNREILVPVQLIRYDGAYNSTLRAHIDQHKKVLFDRHG